MWPNCDSATCSRVASTDFSMNSPRPWKTHTVPRRGGRVGSQRAKRSRTPPRDLKKPVVAPLGTGFFASATRSMRVPLPCAAPRTRVAGFTLGPPTSRSGQDDFGAFPLQALYSSAAHIQTGMKPRPAVDQPPKKAKAPARAEASIARVPHAIAQENLSHRRGCGP